MDHIDAIIADLKQHALQISNEEMDLESLAWWDFTARRIARLRINVSTIDLRKF